MGAGAHTLYRPFMVFRGPSWLESFNVLSTYHTTGPCRPPAQSVEPLRLIHVPALCSSDSPLMFNPILTVSSFTLQSCLASHEYPKVRLLDRIIPPFKANEGDSSATKNALNGSFALLLCFSHFPLLSLSSLLSLSLWAFTKHIDLPSRGVLLLLFIDF